MKLSRREALKLGLLGAGATALPATVLFRSLGHGAEAAPVASPSVVRFSRPLAIPPVLAPTQSTGTTDFYRIVQRPADVQILPGLTTRIWGYNGITPGPTIVAHQGRSAVVTQVNHLGIETTTHLHGADVAPQFDGPPLRLVEPGERFIHQYTNVQPAATLWYHDHAHMHTGRNVYMGLAGFYLLGDATDDALPLPKGQFDIPLAIQDRLFNADGSLFYSETVAHQGVFGDTIIVNGVPFPFLQVARRKYRFRVLNGSNARNYRLKLSTGDPFKVVSTESGFLAHPVDVPEILLQPAERYSFVIDFASYPIGTQVILQNVFTPNAFGDPFDPAKVNQIMRFDVTANASDPSSVPADLAPLPVLNEADAVATRDWHFNVMADGRWAINGLRFDASRFDAQPTLGTVEIWRFINPSSAWVHPIHPHLVHFLILDRNGAPPQPYERGPKDTVALGPGETVRVIMRFEHFRGPFVFHCHNLEHEDHEMMTQYKVV